MLDGNMGHSKKESVYTNPKVKFPLYRLPLDQLFEELTHKNAAGKQHLTRNLNSSQNCNMYVVPPNVTILPFYSLQAV